VKRSARGFTLVELLVALFALALLAALSWRGLDGMIRAQQQTATRADEVLTLQTGLAQWAADLDAIEEFPLITALEWNGRVLRLTRRSTVAPAEGVYVVGWTRREGLWLRWQSAPVTTRGELQVAWNQADQWAMNPGEAMRRQEVAIGPLEEWQIFYFRGGAWTNPQSSPVNQAPTGVAAGGTPGVAAAAGTSSLPEGVRIILQLPPGRAITGTLTRDWVRPTS
jgi:general secretion pathway protein J